MRIGGIGCDFMWFDETWFRSYDIQMLVVHAGLWQRGGFREASLDPPRCSACQELPRGVIEPLETKMLYTRLQLSKSQKPAKPNAKSILSTENACFP